MKLNVKLCILEETVQSINIKLEVLNERKEKDLGVYITNDAKPSLQCTEAAKKTNPSFGLC